MRKTLCILGLIVFGNSFLLAQQSNIRKYTPSKLLEKGQWDFKIFNNLYTENKGIDDKGVTTDYARDFYYTATFEMAYGISKSKKLNIGMIANIKSNVNNPEPVNGEDDQYSLGDVFSFGNNNGYSRSGLTSIAASIKFVPVSKIGNLSIQSSFFIPLIDAETENGVFLDKNSYTWENKIYFDKVIKSKYQLFLELDVNFHFGETISFEYDPVTEMNNVLGGYANNSMALPASIFFSYFPSDNFTIYVMTQHYQLIDLGNEFSQNFTQSGLGTKYQVTNSLNLEILYTNFWRGNSTGLGETFNLGLRYLLN